MEPGGSVGLEGREGGEFWVWRAWCPANALGLLYAVVGVCGV